MKAHFLTCFSFVCVHSQLEATEDLIPPNLLMERLAAGDNLFSADDEVGNAFDTNGDAHSGQQTPPVMSQGPGYSPTNIVSLQ